MMTAIRVYCKKTMVIALLQCIALVSIAQDQKYTMAKMECTITGTSTFHAWEMKSTKGECKASFAMNAAEQLTGLRSLSFSIPSESLKSDSKGMDKSAYRALKTEANAFITFSLISATYSQGGSLKCLGKLSIAGTTLDTDVTAMAVLNADKSIRVTGSKKISMKEYNITPPALLMGAIKSGNEITVTFDLTMTKL